MRNALVRSITLGSTIALTMVAGSLIAIAPAQASTPLKGTTVPKVSLHCDGKAQDAQLTNDCLQQKVLGDAADSNSVGGTLSKVKLTIAPELRGKSLLGEVQYRSVNPNGTKGKWWTHRTIVWHAQDTARSATKTFEACAPVKAGTYEMRTQLAVPVSKESTRTSSLAAKSNRARAFASTTASPTPAPTKVAASSAPTPSLSPTPAKTSTPSASPTATSNATPTKSATATASAAGTPSASASSSSVTMPKAAPYTTSDAITTSAIAPLTVTQSAQVPQCANNAEDQILIEYFNQLAFNQSINIQLNGTSTSQTVTLQCPASPTASIPGPNFDLTMTTMDGSQSTNCSANQPITINKAQLSSGGYSFCSNSICAYSIVYSNRSTGTVFSTSIVKIQVTNGSSTYLPSFNPATAPICNNAINPCLTSGTCALTATKIGTLSLCSTGTNCATPSTTSGYSLNSNVYFQTLINNKVSS